MERLAFTLCKGKKGGILSHLVHGELVFSPRVHSVSYLINMSNMSRVSIAHNGRDHQKLFDKMLKTEGLLSLDPLGAACSSLVVETNLNCVASYYNFTFFFFA